MSTLIIDDTPVEGALSMTGTRGENNVFLITGVLETVAYLDEYYAEIRAGRLVIRDIHILSESFGSETDSIVYEFTAKSYTVLEPEGGT